MLQIPSANSEAVTAISIASIAHLLSVFVLFRLVQLLTAGSPTHNGVPFVAAALHVLSPAGLFLTAPYAESIFSFLSFSAMLAYCKSDPRLNENQARSIRHDFYIILSGLLLGSAAMIRSNALFAGSIYAYDLFALSRSFVPIPRRFDDVRKALCLILAGLFIVFGFAYPQTIAYNEYCNNATEEMPVWCSAIPPSIYTYVQEHYW